MKNWVKIKMDKIWNFTNKMRIPIDRGFSTE